MGTAITYFFDEIFPTYEDWRTFSAQTTAVGENPEPDILAFDKFCYNALYRTFAKQNVRYTTKEQFINALATVYDQKFTQFYKQKQIVDNIYNLTEADYILASQTLTNVANNPNTQPDDPMQPLQYVSAQTVSNLTDNRLKAYLDALNNMPMLDITRFIYGERDNPKNKCFMQFSDLFMNVQPNAVYLYEKE